jgi:hypothetical protein
MLGRIVAVGGTMPNQPCLHKGVPLVPRGSPCHTEPRPLLDFPWLRPCVRQMCLPAHAGIHADPTQSCERTSAPRDMRMSLVRKARSRQDSGWIALLMAIMGKTAHAAARLSRRGVDRALRGSGGELVDQLVLGTAAVPVHVLEAGL